MATIPTYESLMALMQERYSCRRYSDKAIDRDTICRLIEAARIAPSACNRQPWKLLVASSDEARKAICATYNREWIASAPLFIVICGDHDQAWHRAADGKDHTDVDISIAVEHICLAATSLGLGSCWVCNFDAQMLRQSFNLPDAIEPIAILPIGYPTEDDMAPKKVRKQMDEIVVWEKF